MNSRKGRRKLKSPPHDSPGRARSPLRAANLEEPAFAPGRRARSNAPCRQLVQGVEIRSNGRLTTLEVRDLRVERGGTTILDGVNWRVERGQHWVILGANGSGKTSLLSALTGYLTPTAGEISLLDRTYGRADWRELRKQIGIVSSAVRQMMADDEPALETVASGKYAMIDFWGRLSRADKNRARQILRQIECTHLAKRPWRVLSQGERQRALIGRALMARPQVLILDEPCAGLDPAAREHFLQFLQRLGTGKNAPTLVLVTHHVEEIMPVFSHVLLLKNGCALASGKKTNALNSRNLSQAFNARMKLQTLGKRYGLKVQTNYKSPPVL
jgi:iron complex transport system ATP-binding protein